MKKKKARSDKEIEESFQRIDELFDKYASKNKEALENAKLKPFHHKFLFSQNGICPFIAGVGRGKIYKY